MRLLDSFLEPIAWTAHLTGDEGAREISVETAVETFEQIIARLDTRRSRHGFSAGTFDTARFVVLTWIDEAILSSRWSGAAQWVPHSLQRKYYGTYRGGEEVYEHLTEILTRVRAQAPLAEPAADAPPSSDAEDDGRTTGLAEASLSEDRQLLEVFAACLAMGFQGRYHGDARREAREALLFQVQETCATGPLDAWPALTTERSALEHPARPRGQLWSSGVLSLQVLSIILGTAIYLFYRHDLNLMLTGWLSQGPS